MRIRVNIILFALGESLLSPPSPAQNQACTTQGDPQTPRVASAKGSGLRTAPHSLRLDRVISFPILAHLVAQTAKLCPRKVKWARSSIANGKAFRRGQQASTHQAGSRGVRFEMINYHIGLVPLISRGK